MCVWGGSFPGWPLDVSYLVLGPQEEVPPRRVLQGRSCSWRSRSGQDGGHAWGWAVHGKIATGNK